ncbi:AraC family transcriptional regulator [Nocardia stercoris]|uniref:AraC family transcriptional regulator n=2 Tax=Nocardia stercoris TaxID=2483361 RepID=A0A3M2LFX3_9NOCA|nr:AraC family transcriptional regulator [Nocardia stercoris]
MAGFRIRGAAPAQLRAVPHPAVTVAVTIGDHSFDIGATDGDCGGPTARTPSGSVALGLNVEAVPVRVRSVECVQIRLDPVVAPALLGCPVAELACGAVVLDDLWGSDARRLGERLAETSGWAARFATVESALVARLRENRRADPEVAWAWHRLVTTRGTHRVESLAAEVGWSRQRLWSRFGTQIGLTPKRAAMLVRFDHAVHRLVRGDRPAQVAADCGYADQSHLHREVGAFTGTSISSAATEPWLTVDREAWPSTC